MYKYLKKISLVIAGLVIGFLFFNTSLANASLYNCFQDKGLEWTSVPERAEMAAYYGIWNYNGTADQNTLLEGYLCPQEEILGGGFSVATGYKKTLSRGMTASQDYIPVSSLLLPDGTSVSTSTVGSKIFLVVEPGSQTKEEIILCTDTDSTLTRFINCTRGLAYSGTSVSSVTANAKVHNAGSIVVMSNVHYVYEQYVDTNDKDQTIQGDKIATGDWTFLKNTFSLGDGTNTNKTFKFANGATNTPEMVYDATNNQLKFRRSGETSYTEIPLSLRGTYANYASLPTDASNGDIAITTDDYKLYTYNAGGTTWVLAGGSSGAGTVYKTEKLGSESDGGDLKTFTLTAGSWPSTNFLLVYKNGQLQRLGATYDYTEIDSNTIEFTYELATDDLVSMVVVSVDLYNPAWNSVNGSIIPDTDNAYDLGNATHTFKDAYVTGTLYYKGVGATSTPTANAIPIASSTGKIDTNWLVSDSIVSAYASDNLQASANTERTQADGTYTLKKDFNVTLPGSYRLNWQHKTNNAINAVYTKVYFNNVAYGCEKASISTSYVSVTCDVSVQYGGHIQIYLKNNAGGDTSYIKNATINYDIVRSSTPATAVITD